LAQVGVLIIDDDVVSQHALKNVLDSEGWRVRIVPLASHALGELASGGWNLVIVNIALTDVRGPIFALLKELALASSYSMIEEPGAGEESPLHSGSAAQGAELSVTPGASRGVRVLFLVPALAARDVEPFLERDGLPYISKPYHLHDFLEKVSELLLEAGAIDEPIRSMRDFVSSTRRRRGRGTMKEPRRGTMFAPRDAYVMSEEELAEWERQEEEDRKKREREQKEREHLG
jgi:PleD family two-component response regulator